MRKKVCIVAILFLCGLVVAPNATVRIASEGARAPLLGGWGGLRLCESVRYAAGNFPSIVFIGEKASNAEMIARHLKDRGYNTIRLLFESPFLENRSDWAWNDDWWQRTLLIAKTLDLWLIVDYAGFYDQYQLTDRWLGFWRDEIISKYKDSYGKLVWEPINEPVERWADGSHMLSGKDAVAALTDQYQKWINACRESGDNHWIVVSSVCWYNSLPEVEWYPNVTDPLNKVFLTRHFYYYYEYQKSQWTVTDAENAADRILQHVLDVKASCGKPFICTEMGPDYGTEVPPDSQFLGWSNYSNTTFAFVQRLISNFDGCQERIGYVLWPVGDWSTAGSYGSMNIWGNRLNYRPF